MPREKPANTTPIAGIKNYVQNLDFSLTPVPNKAINRAFTRLLSNAISNLDTVRSATVGLTSVSVSCSVSCAFVMGVERGLLQKPGSNEFSEGWGDSLVHCVVGGLSERS
eukprot:1188456-Prorocentrum_minimum.AAC.5